MLVLNLPLPCYTLPVTHRYTILFLQKRLIWYSVLEIVPVLVWQNADHHFHACQYQQLSNTPEQILMYACASARWILPREKVIDIASHSSADSAARQALVLFFFIGECNE